VFEGREEGEEEGKEVVKGLKYLASLPRCHLIPPSILGETEEPPLPPGPYILPPYVRG
jgi:hypothetical protein